MDRLTLEQINNMTESQMREYLRGMEVENQRKDKAEQEEKNKQAEENSFLDEYFKNKFVAQGLNV